MYVVGTIKERGQKERGQKADNASVSKPDKARAGTTGINHTLRAVEYSLMSVERGYSSVLDGERVAAVLLARGRAQVGQNIVRA